MIQGCVQLQLGRTHYMTAASKKMTESGYMNLTQSSTKPPIFDKMKENSGTRELKPNNLNKMPSLSTLHQQPTFTFAEETADSKGKLPKIGNESSLTSKENSNQKPPIINNSKNMKISSSTKNIIEQS